MELIDKATVVAEIERRMKLRYDSYKTYNSLSDFIAWEELEYFKDEFLPTLEAKEVDLDKSLTGFMSRYAYENGGEYPSAIDIAKHFFELGLKTQKGE